MLAPRFADATVIVKAGWICRRLFEFFSLIKKGNRAKEFPSAGAGGCFSRRSKRTAYSRPSERLGYFVRLPAPRFYLLLVVNESPGGWLAIRASAFQIQGDRLTIG